MTPVTKLAPEPTESDVSFPSDIVPDEKNLEVWMHQWVDYIINFGQNCFSERDAANQNCALGIINPADYEHITNLFVAPVSTTTTGTGTGFKKSLPAKLRPINVVAPMINKGIGRVLGEKFEFYAHVVNEDAVSEKLEKFTEEYGDKLTRFIRQQAGVAEQIGAPLVEGDDVQPVNPADLEEADLSTFQQENEIQVTNGLAYLMAKKSIYLKHKLIEQGLRSYWTTGKMAFDTLIENDPNAIYVPPNNLIYELNSTSPFIHHGRYNGYTFSATPQSLIDRCPELDKKEIKKIESQFKTLSANGNLNKNSVYWTWTAGAVVGQGNFTFNPYKVYWCADKKLRVKITPNKLDADNPHQQFIGNDTECKSCEGTGQFEKSKGKKVKCTHCNGTGRRKETANEEKGEKIEYRYHKTWFECLKIGEDIYYQCREIPNQHQPQDEPELKYSPLVGIVDPNPCPVDLVRPLQELRTESWFTIERLLGQAKGNILVVDEAGGQDVWAQNYNMLAFGVYVYDSSLEAPDGQNKKQVPVTKDMGLSQAISDLMRFIAFIDQNIAQATGDNDASRGIIKSDQGLGITQNAMQQTQFTLQPYYNIYYTTVEMVLQALCNLMRPAWAGRKKTAYFMGDEGYKFLNLDPGKKWDLADYGISLTNSIGANQAKQFMVEAGKSILSASNDPEMALSVMKMIRAKSDAECEKIFKQGVRAIRELKEKADLQAQQNQEAQLKIQSQKIQEETRNEKLKAEAPVQVATINAASKSSIEDKKITHEEDKQTVAYKEAIMKVMAEVSRDYELAKNATPPVEQPQQPEV